MIGDLKTEGEAMRRFGAIALCCSLIATAGSAGRPIAIR